MSKNVGRALSLVFVLVVTLGARGAEPMYVPEPIPVPSGVSLADATKAVKDVLAGRGWIVQDTEESEGGITVNAKLMVRVHMVKIKLHVRQNQISIEYVDSLEMQYQIKKGKPYIHPKYTQWIKNIEVDLGVRLAALVP